MTDVVVTVPKRLWAAWLEEGDLPGEEWSRYDSDFWLGHGAPPSCVPGDRIYIVAHGRLRGYAPLVMIRWRSRGYSLVRRDGAEAVTILEAITGFRGWRYRWWLRDGEIAFPDWKDPSAVPS